MANVEQLSILKQGVEARNRWRAANSLVARSFCFMGYTVEKGKCSFDC